MQPENSHALEDRYHKATIAMRIRNKETIKPKINPRTQSTASNKLKIEMLFSFTSLSITYVPA